MLFILNLLIDFKVADVILWDQVVTRMVQLKLFVALLGLLETIGRQPLSFHCKSISNAWLSTITYFLHESQSQHGVFVDDELIYLKLARRLFKCTSIGGPAAKMAICG